MIACSSTTDPGLSEQEWPPWVPPDSAWKVVENLEYAYNTMDLDLYMSCFRDDFEFHLLECGWPPPPPPEPWGYSTEEAIHDSMFGYVNDIDLTFSGSAEWLWSGDSTGQSWELQRMFDLKVYYSIPGSPYEGYQASGTTLFICRCDDNGDWYIWMWFDQSETKERMTWGDIKSLFLQVVEDTSLAVCD